VLRYPVLPRDRSLGGAELREKVARQTPPETARDDLPKEVSMPSPGNRDTGSRILLAGGERTSGRCGADGGKLRRHRSGERRRRSAGGRFDSILPGQGLSAPLSGDARSLNRTRFPLSSGM
jgi:hypothetical protein